ncbi:hypothetical protein GXM_02533 [Nostoc sphaeroides CCNUC1]|uniref:Uncharacterized protein n=1 Tax=Nostoc sphaeroides CCNUC1 TaxID=2653204 RepID=A0A5P8VXC7_9NOSO|nr:hypothetical protein GXM_02533 [Nostoc sphaeroides CCNUC1]
MGVAFSYIDDAHQIAHSKTTPSEQTAALLLPSALVGSGWGFLLTMVN